MAHEAFLSFFSLGTGRNIEGFDVDLGSSYCEDRENLVSGGSGDSVSNYDIDRLPSDPFGMEDTTAFTTFSGCFEGEDRSKLMALLGDDVEPSMTTDELFAGLDLLCSSTVRFVLEVGIYEIDENSNILSFDSFIVSKNLSFIHDEDWRTEDRLRSKICSSVSIDGGGGCQPHDAIFLALGYLDVKDLFSVERVCKSLNEAVKNDPLLWMDIRICDSLRDKITDDALVKLTSRADGRLKSLSLVWCTKITDEGLKRVLESNPGLTKLCVPGCLNFKTAGILNAFRSAGVQGIQLLKTGGYLHVTNEQYEELMMFLDPHKVIKSTAHKPYFYHTSQSYLSADDDRALDIEQCPRCQRLMTVYDCPTEICQKNQAAKPCRACGLCITRCLYCGRCLIDSDYVETFFLQSHCLDCHPKFLGDQQEQGQRGVSLPPIICQETSCQFRPRG